MAERKPLITPWDREDLNRALQTLQSGGIILYPTDTVWGLGCDATNAAAVQRIFHIKQRSDSNGLVVLADGPAMLEKHVKEVPELAWDLMDLSDKPITIVYDNAMGLAHRVTAANGTVGIRLTRDPFCAKLIQLLKKPLVSTSANMSGRPTPNNFQEIEDIIKTAVDYVMEFRQSDTQKAFPSSIIRLRPNGEVTVIRP